MKKLVLCIVVLVSFMASCRREDPIAQQTPNQPTHVDPKSIFSSDIGVPNLPVDNPFTVEGIELGRRLFYDPMLSYDSTISCGSCHKQEYAFADPSPYSKGILNLNTKRNTPALFNMAYSRKFFWDARVNTLRELVFEPIQAHNEMAMTLPLLAKKLQRSAMYIAYFKKAFNAEPNLIDMSKAMEQFLLSIVSKGSRFNKAFPNNPELFTPEELAGAQLFNGLTNFDAQGNSIGGSDCFHCHGGELVQQQNPTMGGLTSNGLKNVTDMGYGAITNNKSDNFTFKTPSLLNIAVSGPYMHDGRFATLDEVIDHYSDNIDFTQPNLSPMMSAHGGKQLKLTPTQKANLKALLNSMTDQEFLTNKAYSNPFKP